MKKSLFIAVSILSTALIVSCKGKNNEKVTEEFKPSLDANTECSLKVVGDYSNFEALETEFERFNAYYPNVTMTYEKVDAYEDNIETVLDSSDKPNIFFTKAYMASDNKYAGIFAKADNLSDPALKINFDCIRPGLINHDAENNVKMIPVFSRTYGTFINNNLFEKENIAIPTTWNELLNVCAAFKGKEYKSPMMGYSEKDSSCLMYTIAYPDFLATLAKDSEALAKANALDESAGEYMRSSLEKVKTLVDNGAINIEECNAIKDNYEKVLLRFLEGDVPMMICGGDTPSGIKKREAKSEAFQANPFTYSFLPIPMSDKGGYFIDSPSIEFSINKNCENLDMTREFMRFLVSTEELNLIAANKGLATATKEFSMTSMYAPFAQVPQERTFSPEMFGVKDALTTQIRKASFNVGKGTMTVNEAIANYGKF